MRAAFNNNDETLKKAPRRFIKRKTPSACQTAAKKAPLETKIDKSDPDFYLFNSTVSEKEKEFIRAAEYVYANSDNKCDKKEVKKCPRCHQLNGCPDEYCFIMDMEGKWVNPMILDLH